MGICASNKVKVGDSEIAAAASGDDSEDVPVKPFGKKGRRKRDSIAYNKEAMAKRDQSVLHKQGSHVPESMIERIE
tara:strand:- start:39 stop:266 length:228 start_codon:yes stop_codon:yes gene_type:complete